MSSIQLDDRFSHHTIEANGVHLHYVIGGQGEPVLLWHGFLETWYCWRRIMPALAKQYTVIAPDMRGYGDSDKPTSGDCASKECGLDRVEAISTPSNGESRLPTLVQYDPFSRFFEVQDGTLLFSGESGLPLVRYHIVDVGGLLTYDQMLQFLSGWGFAPIQALQESSTTVTGSVSPAVCPCVCTIGVHSVLLWC